MHRRLQPIARLLVVPALAAALAACGAAAVPILPAASSGDALPLVRMELRGGHCRSGECRSVVTITPAGTVSRDGGQAASVPQPMLADLVDAIRATDFDAVLARPFTGECPTAYDGQEAVFTVATPGDGQVQIASCSVEVDPRAPLFAAIGRIVDLAPSPGS